MSFLQFTMFLLPIIVLGVTHHLANADEVSFDTYYIVKYGNDHFSQLNGGTEVQLSLDQTTGAGFISKESYSSGLFEISIKLPSQSSPGVVSTFYLTSSNGGNDGGNHDELDFEFLGTDGPPFTLQTNIFAHDNGRREERIQLSFDPTQDFHKYGILWDQVQIMFFVDNKPIREYKNIEGARYPTRPMFAEGSIWNEDTWASGGRKIDWSKAPFQLRYQGFNINGTVVNQEAIVNPTNTSEFWNLTQN